MLLLLMQMDFLRLFIDDVTSSNWAELSQSWLTTAAVVAICGSGLVFAAKGFRKYTARLEKNKIWTRGQTWLLIFSGMFPIFVTLLAIWYLTLDFFMFIGTGGLFKATIFAWFAYLVLMVVGHLLSPWRRELF